MSPTFVLLYQTELIFINIYTETFLHVFFQIECCEIFWKRIKRTEEKFLKICFSWWEATFYSNNTFKPIFFIKYNIGSENIFYCAEHNL